MQQASWILSTYSGYADEALGSTLRYSEVVSLYFPELRRYLTVASESEVISKNNDFTNLKEQVDELNQRLHANEAKHIVVLVRNPDTADVKRKNLVRCMWVLEHERPERGGAVSWDRTQRDDAAANGQKNENDLDLVEPGKVRLRHLFTAQYLSIDGAGMAQATPRRSEATVLLIKPVSIQIALKLREQPNEASDTVGARSLVYLMNGNQFICGGGKCSLQHNKEAFQSNAGPFTLEQCEKICGHCWSEMVCASLNTIAQQVRANLCIVVAHVLKSWECHQRPLL